jgi:hypothetical protein
MNKQGHADGAEFGVVSGESGHRHALAPILLGLLAPALVILIIDAKALTNPGLVLQIYMIAVFVVASVTYFVSLFDTAEVTRVTFDQGKREVTIESTGFLTKQETAMPFADVVTVRMQTRYDDDGYQTAVPVMVLTTREEMPLPAGTTEHDLLKMRGMLGRR